MSCKQSLSNSLTFKVCGNRARGSNYGGISCSSCKVFFHRNSFRPKVCILQYNCTISIEYLLFFQIVDPCQFDGQCEVNSSTRQLCMPCRLAKCLAIGMSADLIRKEYVYKSKASSTTKSNKTQVSKFKVIKISIFSFSFEQQKLPYSHEGTVRKTLTFQSSTLKIDGKKIS